MAELIQSPRILDVILIVIGVEAALLIALRAKFGIGPQYADMLAMLLAGAALLGAWRASLAGASWEWIALFLSAALVAHLADLARRWRP
ncbi:MAG: hypothetical protein HXY30_08260 [Pseudorhodoplanes sp.]|nr:hypothetical protein [Pseudorhodoplanes sp.]